MDSVPKQSGELHPVLVEAIGLAVISSSARAGEMVALRSELASILSKSDLRPVERAVIRACLERVIEVISGRDTRH